jgi:hypothetical protein
MAELTTPVGARRDRWTSALNDQLEDGRAVTPPVSCTNLSERTHVSVEALLLSSRTDLRVPEVSFSDVP